MSFRRVLPGALVFAIAGVAAQTPLPELRIEPTAGGSIFYVRNVTAQPLTAYVIELVDYPGSSYSLWQDEIMSQPIAPGTEKRIPVANMTVGAVPDYVKIRAALYADGSSAGLQEKVDQLIARRRTMLETTRELIARIEKAQSAGTAQTALVADLKQWAESMQPPGKGDRNSTAAISQAAARSMVVDCVGRVATSSIGETLGILRTAEKALSTSKPVL